MSRRRKTGPVQQRLLLDAPPSPLSSRPERSVVERSAVSGVLPWAGDVKAEKNGSCSATTVVGSAALPFVISTGAQRSGEIFVVSGPSLGRRSQGEEKRVLFSNDCCWKRRPPLCHLDRSAAEGRDLRCQRSFPGPEKSRRRKTGLVQQRLLLEAPPPPLSSRPERGGVERSAVSAVLPWAGEVKAMKRVPFSNDCCWQRPPPPLSSRPERSVVERSAVSAVLPWAGEVKAMKRVLFRNDCCWKRRPPLCHLDRSAA